MAVLLPAHLQEPIITADAGWPILLEMPASFLDNDAFKESGKRYFQEWLMFGVFPDGMTAIYTGGLMIHFPKKDSHIAIARSRPCRA